MDEKTPSQGNAYMLEEYRDLYQNVIHIENHLFNHLSFFTTLFLGIVTATVAIIQLTRNQSTPMNPKDILVLLAIPFGLLYLVGRFELRMTTELRIRKMKFVEGVTLARLYFTKADPSIAEYLALPYKIENAPPFLRVGSQDWYQLLYLCALNSISFFIAWTGAPFFFVFVANLLFSTQWDISMTFILIWEAIGLFMTWFTFWRLSYLNVMNYCAAYDKAREARMGKPIEYSLLSRPLPKSRLEWTPSDWISHFDKEHR